MSDKTLLAVFAHPDDESFGTGGTLSRYASEGYRVELICATRGEAGEISDSSLATPENLGEVREAELRCSAEMMGIRQPHFLGYRDSGMMGTPENNDPRCLWQANRYKAVGDVVWLIREVRPDVVVTFEPNGGYGHPDHIAIHQITVAAVAAAARPGEYPNQVAAGLQPHQVSKFYYTALPKRFFRAVAKQLAAAGVDTSRMGGVRDGRLEDWGFPDELVTTEIDVSAVLDKKSESFWCHRTQLNPEGAFAKVLAIGGDAWREPMGTEYYQRVRPQVSDGEPVETDLFAGLI
jgi:N-acetyl-1-D-myo-inositol-2-amino-2-deoxy-alpha-D-glucopyranoside deacetylase